MGILHFISLGDVAVHLYAIYISSRYQNVNLSAVNSHSLVANLGVYQGSILRPILYTIYT